eukprot:354196-Chlamydomonas_euryale.AAC.5
MQRCVSFTMKRYACACRCVPACGSCTEGACGPPNLCVAPAAESDARCFFSRRAPRTHLVSSLSRFFLDSRLTAKCASVGGAFAC